MVGYYILGEKVCTKLFCLLIIAMVYTMLAWQNF